MPVILHCDCDLCRGRDFDDAFDFLDAHPGETRFVISVDGRPYSGSPQSVPQMFDWGDEPL